MKTVIIHDYMIVSAGHIPACALPGNGHLGQHGGHAVPAALQDRGQRTLHEKQRRKGILLEIMHEYDKYTHEIMLTGDEEKGDSSGRVVHPLLPLHHLLLLLRHGQHRERQQLRPLHHPLLRGSLQPPAHGRTAPAQDPPPLPGLKLSTEFRKDHFCCLSMIHFVNSQPENIAKFR